MLSRRVIVIPNVAITTSLSTTAEVAIDHNAAGKIYVPSGSHLTALTFYGLSSLLVNLHGACVVTGYTAMYGPDLLYGIAAGAALTITVAASGVYTIPSTVFSVGAMKMVGTFSSGATGSIDCSFMG